MSKEILRLTFFGDSICVGQGVSIYRGWISRIAEALDNYLKGQKFDVLVTNSSVNGRTTRQALEDMPYHVQNSGVDLLVIQFGLNDCNYWLSDRGMPRVSRDAYISNLKEIYTRAKVFGAQSIVLNTNHPTTRNSEILPFTEISYEQSNEHYNSALRECFSDFANDLSLVDINSHFKNSCVDSHALGEMLLSDQLHLSEKGHEAYFHILYPVILKKIETIASERGLI